MSKETLFILLFLVAWIVLNRWVLPHFGVSTCMSGACGLPPRVPAQEQTPEQPGSEATKVRAQTP